MGRGNVLGTLKKIRNWANIFIFPKKSLPRCGCDFIKWNWKMKQILRENSNTLLVARMVECATCAQARPGPPSMFFLHVLDHATWVAFANACHGSWAATWAGQILAQHDHIHWIFGPRESLLRKYGQHVRLFI